MSTSKVLISDRKKIDLAFDLHFYKNKELGKKEALTVQRLIQEILIDQLNIPSRQIVNDTTFSEYTDSKRPDLLISEFEYDQDIQNDSEFIENLVAYAEVKDDCSVDDSDWLDAKTNGKKKAPKLKLPYFIVTNCKTTIFYNVQTRKEIKLNGNPIREFQTIDILRLIKNHLSKNPKLNNIITNVDSLSVISEAVFNKKLWELKKIYRDIKFENKVQIIDFTIGFIALEFFEEKAIMSGTKDNTKTYWSDCLQLGDDPLAKDIVSTISNYIAWLEQASQFNEFHDFIEKVRVTISGKGTDPPLINADSVKQIYNLINTMRPLHGTGFDLFGTVYEMFATNKEKKDFGEYFTRRHYTHVLAKLLLEKEQHFDKDRKFRVLDPACGTGGFLTESFKILHTAYVKTKTLNSNTIKFLEGECFWGIDVRKDNISRTKLNMFLVGDGHTNMIPENTLEYDFKDEQWDYVITNPPYGAGTISADTSYVSSKRTEVAFLFKIIGVLKDGGSACVILPDGILENPSLENLRKEFLEKCDVYAIVSLPKFAFAPYTKEKTYAVFFTKKNKELTVIQKKPIWMYIIDNDGLANSDKRFPTKLRNNRNGWMHDEISGWVSTKGEEMQGTLEERWMTFDDGKTNGTEWINEKGEKVRTRKGGFIQLESIMKTGTYLTLLPEYHLRHVKPNFITFKELKKEIQSIEKLMEKL